MDPVPVAVPSNSLVPPRTDPIQPPPSKKRKAVRTNSNGEETREPKKRPQSCDVCRARKVKCVKQPDAPRCDGCVSLDQRCEYTHERKKPGPVNSFARKPSPPRTSHLGFDQNGFLPMTIPTHPTHVRSYSHGATPSANNNNNYASTSDNGLGLPRWNSNDHLTFGTQSTNISESPLFAAPVNGGGGAPLNTNTDLPYNLEQHFLPISPNSLLHPQPGEADSSSEDSPMGRWAWMSGMDEIFDQVSVMATSTSNNNTQQLPQLHQSTSTNGNNTNNMQTQMDLHGPSASASAHRNSDQLLFNLPTSAPPDRKLSILPKCQRIEDVAPFSTITKILQAYHAHLYSLMPVVHWPTFSQQLIAREDERSDTWRAFLLSLVAYSIIQLPRSSLAFIPMKDLRRLHQRCHAESKRLRDRKYLDVKLIDVATLYCDHIYLGTLGRTHEANVHLAEAIRLAQVLNLHDERLGDPIYDVVERETRRRVFWLLYGSDRTITALTSVPMHIQDYDVCVPLPLSIDDSLLTSAGSFPQPPHTVPVLAGFHFNVRLFRLLGALLTAHRVISAAASPLNTDPYSNLNLPPLPVTIRPASHFFDELDRLLGDLPGPLQLVNAVRNGNTNGNTGNTSTPSTVLSGSDTGYKGDPAFATCRANLLVTQAMVRFAIRQYAKVVGEEESEDGGKEWAERDVLSLLESMSSESLAANGESLRRKVLFVASSLLEKYPSTTEGHNYVSDFLAVYTRISEEHYSSLLAESVAPSREGSPSRVVGGGGGVQTGHSHGGHSMGGFGGLTMTTINGLGIE